VVRPQVADCFADHPSVDAVVIQDPRRHRGPIGTLRFARELARRDYDLAVLFQKAIGAALLARLARIPRRVGYDTDGRGILLTDPIPETPASRAQHHVEYFLGVARGAGCDTGNGARPRVVFPLDAPSRTFAETFLAARGAARFPWLAAVAVGASKPGRAWHAERFAALAAQLARDHGAGIVVLGGPADRAEAARVLVAVGDSGIDAVGATTVRGMAALIERCRVFVGNDSGPMHVAAALDVPVLAMFGPGVPAKTAPWMPPERFVALSENFHCSPCRQDFFRECDPSPALKPMCLETITVDRAAAALESLLARTAS
jgi:heptosyltransferase-2